MPPTLEKTIDVWAICAKHTGLMGIRNREDIAWIVANDQDGMMNFLQEICELVGWRNHGDDN